MTWSQVCRGITYNYRTGEFSAPIFVDDIARVLSLKGRYHSWSDTEWSIASHACLVAEIIAAVPDYDRSAVMDGLHHDNHEALVGDCGTPQMQAWSFSMLLEWRAHKRRAQTAIDKQLKLHQRVVNKAIVSAADLAALESERRILFVDRLSWPELESSVSPKLVEIGTRIMAGDFAKITRGPDAAARYVRMHKALL